MENIRIIDEIQNSKSEIVALENDCFGMNKDS